LREAMMTWVDLLEQTPARIDYFATSLPSMLLFNDDLQVELDQLVVAIRQRLRDLAPPDSVKAAP
jgi:hypothetical protein